MGYYSDTALCLSPDAYKEMSSRMALLSEEEEDLVRDFFNSAEHYEHERHHCFFWSCVKWYDTFPEIEFINRLIDTLSHEDYYILRIGEDYDDTDFRGGLWGGPFNIELQRSISINKEFVYA